MHFRYLIFASFILLSVGACTNEYVQNVNPVCFESDVLPIFQSNCTQSGCHNAIDRAHGHDYSTYEGIVRDVEPGNYKQSEAYKVLVIAAGEAAMPPAPYNRLSDDQIATVALWIQEGAGKTTCSNTTCVIGTATYSGTVKPILDTYCNGCHGGSSPLGNVNYNTYNGVKATVTNGTLVGSIDHAAGFSPMPQNASKLSSCNIQKIKAWIAAGALNN